MTVIFEGLRFLTGPLKKPWRDWYAHRSSGVGGSRERVDEHCLLWFPWKGHIDYNYFLCGLRLVCMSGWLKLTGYPKALGVRGPQVERILKACTCPAHGSVNDGKP